MTQTHQPTARTKETCKRGPFPKRLKGFEPSTFLHGKQGVWFLFGGHIPCKRAGSQVWVWFCDSRLAPRVKRGFGHRRGTRQLPRCWPQRCWAATSCLARRRCGQLESLRGAAVRDRRRGAGRGPHAIRPSVAGRGQRGGTGRCAPHRHSVRQPAGSGRDPSGSQVHPPKRVRVAPRPSIASPRFRLLSA